MCLNRTTGGADHHNPSHPNHLKPHLSIAPSLMSRSNNISRHPDIININPDRKEGFSRERSNQEEIIGPQNTKIIQINGRQVASNNIRVLLLKTTIMKRCSMNIQGGLLKIIRLHNIVSGLNNHNQIQPITGRPILSILHSNQITQTSGRQPKKNPKKKLNLDGFLKNQ